MGEFIYTMKNVRKAIGDKVILDNVTMAFYPGAKIGVVGPNGAGKSSILKIMAGLDQPSNGEAFLDPGATVGILLQEPPLNEEKTVRENVEEGLGDIFETLKRYNAIAEEMATNYTDELMEEMGKLQEKLDAADAWEIDSKIEQAMEALRCPPSDEPVTHLSGGERRRVALAKLLLAEPDLLLLDEPTNHLDAGSSSYLSEIMASWPGPVLFSSHDRAFIDEVATAVVDLDTAPWQALATASGDSGPMGAYRCTGRYSDYLVEKAHARSSHHSLHQRQQEQRRKLARHRRDSEIVGHSGAAPRTEARIARKFYADRAQRVSTRRQTQDDRRLEALASTEVRRPRSYDLQLRLTEPAPRTGMAVSARSAAVPGRLAPVTVDVMAGEHLLVTGANGSGKSTLLTWMGRRSAPTEDSVGSLTVSGSVLRIPQHLPKLGDPGVDENVWTKGIGDRGRGALHPRLWNRPISELSDGNQRRVQLALAAAAGPEVLVVDEPTNYLDLDALEMLEAALRTWTGTLIVASHDRWLIEHWWGRRLHLR